MSEPPNIVTAVFGQLIAFNTEGVDPGYGGVSQPYQTSTNVWNINLTDQSTMTETVAHIRIVVGPTGKDTP